MNFNTVTNSKICYDLIQQSVPLAMVYYTHIPASIAALIIGTFILLKNRKLVGWIIFLIAVFFSLWTFTDIILWTSANSQSYMFFWSIIIIFEAVLYMLNLYLIKVFSDGNDIKFWNKIVWLILLLPIFILVPTTLNKSYFDAANCLPVDNVLYNRYVLPLYGLLLIWFIVIVVVQIRKTTKENKTKIKLISAGSFFFLFLFFASNLLIDYLINNNIMSVENSYKFEMYSLFAMPIFLGLVAYIIVRFKAFNIKLIASQALVATLIILIGSMFFFVQNLTSQILVGVTLALSLGFGWMLVRSVKLEVERKEQLQVMSDKLASANDQLRKLDNAKSEFISIASHQLRTPLTAIKGFISLLLEGSYGKLVPQQEDVLNKVYTSNERLVNLVEDLLNISRIESGRMEFKFDKWQMETICQEVVDTFVLKAKSHDLYLEYKKPENPLPEVMVDGGKVREVISNIVDNALKYCPKGGVTLKLEQVADNIRVTVSDTGIGIPAAELPYLFSKFSRGKDTSRLNTGGTGLGLYVGKSMIENNGGRIWAESDGEGLGSCFIIEIPIQQDEELLKKWG